MQFVLFSRDLIFFTKPINCFESMFVTLLFSPISAYRPSKLPGMESARVSIFKKSYWAFIVKRHKIINHAVISEKFYIYLSWQIVIYFKTTYFFYQKLSYLSKYCFIDWHAAMSF